MLGTTSFITTTKSNRTGMKTMVWQPMEYYIVMKTNKAMKRENSYMHKHGWEFQQQSQEKSHEGKSDFIYIEVLVPFTSKFKTGLV